MNEHDYILEKFNGKGTRYICPGCGQKGKFTRYINVSTGKYLADNVGRCDRQDNCGYHYSPKQYFIDNKISQPNQSAKQRTIAPLQKPTSYIPDEVFRASLKGYDTNIFAQFLLKLFGREITEKLISKYFIGSSNYWPGSVVFWQRDINGKIRSGKIIQYEISKSDQSFIGLDCKRNKKNFPPVQWVHKALNLPDYELKQALFGEHLLKDISKPIAIVESEKTAIIASVYLPQFIWLATGGKENLSPDKLSVLRGRKVILYPDINGFEKWQQKAIELEKLLPGTRFKVSDLLERKANDEERKNGLDIADYLIRYDVKEFTKPAPKPIENKISPIENYWLHCPDQLREFVTNPNPNYCNEFNQITGENLSIKEFTEKSTKLYKVHSFLNMCFKNSKLIDFAERFDLCVN